MKKSRIIALVVSAVLALSGCAPSAEPISGKFQIVASTNVWGDIAKQVGGDLVEVTSIIDDANKDPHSYEATARDQLAVEKADLLIANGGGYDDFIEKLSEAAGNKSIFRVTSAVTAVEWQQNEHLWYSISAVGETAYALAETLGSLDPNNSAAYLTNADKLVEGLTGVAAIYGEVRKNTEGYTYFGTEPLAAWLMEDLGFINKTPEEFSEAIENETDVPPRAMKESLDLIKNGEIKYLVINAQTENSQVQMIIDAASAAGVRAVVLSEVLPTGMTYVEWMGRNLVTLDPSR